MQGHLWDSYSAILKKKSSYVGGVSVCIFVVLSVAKCVAGANNFAGTISCMMLKN